MSAARRLIVGRLPVALGGGADLAEQVAPLARMVGLPVTQVTEVVHALIADRQARVVGRRLLRARPVGRARLGGGDDG